LELRDLFKTGNNIFFHLVDISRFRRASVTVLGSSPVLLYKIKFTMKFRVEITYMTTRVDKFFKMGFLCDEIWLGEEKAAATTVSFAWHT
jgi:hypothetical protein